MNPPRRVAGFEGETVYGGAGEWRYDHPDGAVVWVTPGSHGDTTVRLGPTRSVEDALRNPREPGEPFRSWSVYVQPDPRETEMIVSGAPRDATFRRAADWMRDYAGAADDPFGFGAGGL